MTEFANTSPETGSLSIEDAATQISAMWDSAIEDDSVTTDEEIVDENTTSETTDEIVEDHPETESETFEEVEEDNTTDGLAFNDDTKVRMDDGSEVTIAEIKKGYLRQADYTRKTQELAIEREKLGTMENEKVQIRNSALNEIGNIKHQLAVRYKYDFNIDWQALANDDPYEYASRKESYAAFERDVQDLHNLELAMKQENERQESANFLENQRKAREQLIEAFPEFANRETAQPILKGMTQFLKDHGFSKREIEGIADSRILTVLYEAYKAKNVSKAVPQAKAAIASKPKIAAPKSMPHGNSNKSKSLSQLEKTGSIEDAAALIMQYL